MNNMIDPTLCTVSYASFDEVVRWVKKCRKGSLLAKTVIELAFRLLPVHLDSDRLLGCHWEGQFFVDRCLPMGCAISCSYFEMFSSFLEWVAEDLSGLCSVLHDRDDFLVIGPPGEQTCLILLSTLQHISGFWSSLDSGPSVLSRS